MRHESPLAAVERALKVSPERRLELIEEVDADVVALQAELERRGYSPAAARRAALCRLLPATETLATLETQHAPWLGRWLSNMGIRPGIECLGATAVAVLAAMSLWAAIWRWDNAGASTLLACALVVVVALLAANWFRAAASLWIDGSLAPERRRLLWARQVGLIVTAISLGGLGATWEGYTALGAPDASFVAAWTAVHRSVFFAALGFGAALLGLLGWLAVIPRLITDETVEGRITALLVRPHPVRALRTQTRRH